MATALQDRAGIAGPQHEHMTVLRSDRGSPKPAKMEKAMVKLLYKPVSALVGVLGGIIAGVIFKRAWKIIGRGDDAPRPTDRRKGWHEILLAAGLQGAIFAVVKAAIDRSAAEGTRKITGVWPGEHGED